jgi:intracellular septation protein
VTAARQERMHPVAKLVTEIGPLVIFFFANSRYGIFTATAAFMIATLVSLSVSYAVNRRLAVLPLVTGVFVLVFGGLTIWLNDELFIKLKPTIVNTLFGLILLGGLAFGRPLLQVVLDSVVELTREGWRKLTLRWGLFFLFLAVVNEVVWRNFSTDAWVTFKVFGIMPITMVFALAQVPLLTRYRRLDTAGGEE